jgi:hypothetical protein
VTASRFDLLVLAALLGVACKPKAPAEPPGRDAADAKAPVTKYRAAPSPYETSAWDGVELDAGGGHHHGHGHHGHGAAKEAK